MESIYDNLPRLEPTGEILKDGSTDWQKQKLKSLAVSKVIRTDTKTMLGRSKRMFECASTLEFEHNDSGERRLKRVWFCKDRMCPMCQKRRSLVVFHQVKNVCSAIAKDFPNYKYLLLTLTIPNVKADELGGKIDSTLRSEDHLKKTVDDVVRGISNNSVEIKKPKKPDGTLDALAKGWKRLTLRKEFKLAVKGWFRTLEVTYNASREDYHPHYHILICVPPSFFKKHYIRQSRWLELWQEAMKDDSITQVDVRAIKPNPKKSGSDAISSAAAEVGKYATKPSDYLIKIPCKERYIAVEKVVQDLAEGLNRRKLVAFGGIMLDYSKLLKLQDVDSDSVDLVNTDGDSDQIDAIYTQIFRWNIGLNNYIC